MLPLCPLKEPMLMAQTGQKWKGIQNAPQLLTPLLLYVTLITSLHQKIIQKMFLLRKLFLYAQKRRPTKMWCTPFIADVNVVVSVAPPIQAPAPTLSLSPLQKQL